MEVGNCLSRGWGEHRKTADIMVFGSFDKAHLKMLDALIGHLKVVGYEGTRRMPSTTKRKPSEVILEECLQAARTAPLAIMVFFCASDEPNQSVVMEVKERLDRLEEATGRLPGGHNTLLLLEKGVKPKALLRGLARSAGISTTESWRHQKDLNELAQGWLLSLCLDDDWQ